MFDFVFELTLDFIKTMAWYIPILILFGFIGRLVFGGRK